MVPSSVSAQVWLSPALMTPLYTGVQGGLACPEASRPQQTALFAVVTPQVWPSPVTQMRARREKTSSRVAHGVSLHTDFYTPVLRKRFHLRLPTCSGAFNHALA